MSTDRQECHEEITRNGELQPCERPAVGYRVDPAHDVPYPVCRPHLREPVFVPPLQLGRERGDIVSARRDLRTLSRLRFELCRLFGHRWEYRRTFVGGVFEDECARCGALFRGPNERETP